MGIYNLISPDHPEKAKFYLSVAEKMNLETIHFKEDDENDKIVISPAVKQLGYSYLFSSPYDFPLV